MLNGTNAPQSNIGATEDIGGIGSSQKGGMTRNWRTLMILTMKFHFNLTYIINNKYYNRKIGVLWIILSYDFIL